MFFGFVAEKLIGVFGDFFNTYDTTRELALCDLGDRSRTYFCVDRRHLGQ